MREVLVVPTGDREHADEIEDDRDRDGSPTPSNPNDPQAHAMDYDERDAPEPVHLRWALHIHVFEACPGIKPAEYREQAILGFPRG
jgi:hypothetical protein